MNFVFKTYNARHEHQARLPSNMLIGSSSTIVDHEVYGGELADLEVEVL